MIGPLTLTLLLWQPLQIAQNPSDSTSNCSYHFASKYCNDAFRFCVGFPGEMLPLQTEDKAGNGCTLRSTEPEAELSVHGFLNPKGLAPRQLFEQFMQQACPPGEQPVIVSSLFAEDYYEGFFLLGERSFYHQVFLFEGYYVRLSLQTPISQPMLMRELRKQVELEFLPLEEEGLLKDPPVSSGVGEVQGSGSE